MTQLTFELVYSTLAISSYPSTGKNFLIKIYCYKNSLLLFLIYNKYYLMVLLTYN